jgi:hypothetical protein
VGGVHQLSVDGEPLGPPVDTYRPSIARQTLRFPDTRIAEGRHVFRARVMGRNPQSTGYSLGLDVLEFGALDETGRE